MKAIKCEMCDGIDVVKQGDFYVCQSCGTKYETEAARRLMVELDGAVKIDHTAFVESSLVNARRAKEKEDWEECEKYYNLVEQHEPSNIEAIFYSSYGKAMQSLVDADIYKRQAAFKPLRNSISIVDDNFDVERIDEQMEIVRKISADIDVVSSSTFVNRKIKNGYGMTIRDDKASTTAIFRGLHEEFAETLANIAAKVPDSEKDVKIELYELAAKHLAQAGIIADRQTYLDMADKLRDPEAFEKRKADEAAAAEKAAEKAKADAAASRRRMKIGGIVAAVVVVLAVAIGIGVNYAQHGHFGSDEAMREALQGTHYNVDKSNTTYSKLVISLDTAKTISTSGETYDIFHIDRYDDGSGRITMTPRYYVGVKLSSEKPIDATVKADGSITFTKLGVQYTFSK